MLWQIDLSPTLNQFDHMIWRRSARMQGRKRDRTLKKPLRSREPCGGRLHHEALSAPIINTVFKYRDQWSFNHDVRKWLVRSATKINQQSASDIDARSSKQVGKDVIVVRPKSHVEYYRGPLPFSIEHDRARLGSQSFTTNVHKVVMPRKTICGVKFKICPSAGVRSPRHLVPSVLTSEAT